MLSTICRAGNTSWIIAATLPMSHILVSAEISGCYDMCEMAVSGHDAETVLRDLVHGHEGLFLLT
jgi:hypothetical protein